jgi:hypothetical protein
VVIELDPGEEKELDPGDERLERVQGGRGGRLPSGLIGVSLFSD